MPKNKKTHEDFLRIVCAVCTLKNVNKPDNQQNITPELNQLIKKHHSSDYDILSMSTVVCNTCVYKLKQKETNENSKAQLPKIDYSKLIVRMTTRSAIDCQCGWCVIGRKSGLQYIQHEKSVKGDINKNVKKPDVVKICSFCKGVIARGVSHKCLKQNRTDNLGNILKMS